MQLHVPHSTSALADSVSAGARRISTALSGVGMTTEAALDLTETQIVAAIADLKVLRMEVRGIRAEARRNGRRAAA